MTAQHAYLDTIRQAIMRHPRSQQRAPGPSELGNECQHCLAAKLAGWQKNEEQAAWLPALGTAVHAWLAEVFPEPRYLVEQPVNVGWLGDYEIWGTSDLYDTETQTVVDHKLTGATTLRSAKRGPSQVYRAQAHLYGRGFVNMGYPVKTVAISYLPRNSITLDAAVWWEEPYSPEFAQAVIDHASDILHQVETLARINVTARDIWIKDLPRAAGCYDCARYPDYETKPLSSVEDLVA